MGKSSLINLLPVRRTDGDRKYQPKNCKRKAYHEAFRTDHDQSEDSYIMDTPGFSSLYVNDFEKEELKYYFPEFSPYEGKCRFNGCDHIHEPGCAVKAGSGRAEQSIRCGMKIIQRCIVN